MPSHPDRVRKNYETAALYSPSWRVPKYAMRPLAVVEKAAQWEAEAYAAVTRWDITLRKPGEIDRHIMSASSFVGIELRTDPREYEDGRVEVDIYDWVDCNPTKHTLLAVFRETQTI